MKLLSATDFFAATLGGRPTQMNMSVYDGHPFECACGDRHIFSSDQVMVLRELPKMRLVFQCPEKSEYVTCVKVTGIIRFKGFKSLFGARTEKDTDVMDTLKDAFEKRFGIKMDNNETD